MCGRFTLRTPIKAVAAAFQLDLNFNDLAATPARFNIAPSQLVAAVRSDEDRPGRELAWLQWGLVPRWADDPTIGNRLINARAETVATKPAFRDAFRHRRCLIPADGFYEWKRQGRGKQPYYIRLRDELPFALAGLWERWEKGGLAIESCTIITTDANELLATMHTRMPVILDREDFDRWLDPTVSDTLLLEPLLSSYPAERMMAYPVSSVVNSPGHDVPECIEAVAPAKVQGSLFD